MALQDHAIVEREGFKVPLLGIPPDAVLQECELCHNEYSLRDVEMTDSGQILCKKCRANAMPNDQKLRHPEPNVPNNQKAHSQIRSANEGLPPALC
jgi:hypothetical protein